MPSFFTRIVWTQCQDAPLSERMAPASEAELRIVSLGLRDQAKATLISQPALQVIVLDAQFFLFSLQPRVGQHERLHLVPKVLRWFEARGSGTFMNDWRTYGSNKPKPSELNSRRRKLKPLPRWMPCVSLGVDGLPATHKCAVRGQWQMLTLGTSVCAKPRPSTNPSECC